MAKSFPAAFVESAFAFRSSGHSSRRLLLLCLLLLALVLQSQYGLFRFGQKTDTDGPTGMAALKPVAVKPDASLEKYRAMGEYLAQRYRVSAQTATAIVASAHAAGKQIKVDPGLILAVIAVESRFNPIAQSTMGAKGLMQIIPRFHTDKFSAAGGEQAAFDPATNIMVGTRILKDYIRRTGDLGDALQMYVGASSDENENGYTAKVISERDRLNQVLHKFDEVRRHPRQSTPI